MKIRELKDAFSVATKEPVGALIVFANAVFISSRVQIVELTAKNRLPLISQAREYAEAGGLMAYGPNLSGLMRRAATFVDKILKGARPGDLPIEHPTKFQLVINLKAATAIGLTIPQSLLLRADEVIQ